MVLFRQRDKLVVHPIEKDTEWLDCIRLIVSAFETVSLAKKARRRTHKLGQQRPRNAEAIPEKSHVNGYKLFYFRDFASVSRAKLSKASGVSARRISYLEQIWRDRPLGEACFKKATIQEIRNLDKALRAKTTIEFGQEDDFLAYYIEYYKNNWKKSRKKRPTKRRSVSAGESKAVVFDFGGTLTKPKFDENTWERIWKSAGFSLEEPGQLHHKFSTGKIAHQEWCDLTCKMLRDKSFTQSDLRRVYEEIEAIDGLQDAFQKIRESGTQIHIVSGSLREIIVHVLGDGIRFVDSIRSNEMHFDSDGKLSKIQGHPYDFEGKAKFISALAQDLSCDPIDILFVGNSLNDERAATSGARTLCVNPKHTHPYVESMWNHTIRKMTNLRQVLDYI